MERKEKILENARWRRVREFLNGTMEEDEVLDMLDLLEIRVDDMQRMVRIFEKAIKRRVGGGKRYKFTFEAEGHRRMKPYVAKLRIEDNELERKFMNLIFEQNGSKVRVHGEYFVEVGDIIEKRLNGNKDDERYWYIVNEEGKEIELTSIKDKAGKKKVFDYMKGLISAKELLESVSSKK